MAYKKKCKVQAGTMETDNRDLALLSNTSEHSSALAIINCAINEGVGLRRLEQRAKDLIDSEASMEKKFQLCRSFFRVPTSGVEQLAAVHTVGFDKLAETEAWRAGGYDSLEDALNALDTKLTKALRSTYADSLKRKARAWTAIEAAWGKKASDIMESSFTAEHAIEKVARCADRYSLHEALGLVIKVTVNRIRKGCAGRAGAKVIQQGDWLFVAESPQEQIKKVQEQLDYTDEQKERFGFREPDWVQELLKEPQRLQKRKRAETHGDPRREDRANDEEESDDEEANEGASLLEVVLEEERNEGQSSVTVGEIGEIKTVLKTRACNCRFYNKDLRIRLSKGNRNAAGLVTQTARYEALQALFGTRKSSTHICDAHVRSMAAHCGLKSGLRIDLVRSYLEEYWRAVSNDEVERFEADEAHKDYFRSKLPNQRWKLEDDQGIFKHSPSLSTSLIKLSDEAVSAILREPGCPRDAEAIWNEDGSLVIDEVFSFLSDGVVIGDRVEPGVDDIIDLEFRCYAYHWNRGEGRKNSGWLHDMVFSLTQQVIRVDPFYWSLHVALRPDHNTRLVSYPYPAAYSTISANTARLLTSLSIPLYISKGRGQNLISSSVSLDDEADDTGYTEVVTGLHKNHKLEKWWKSAVKLNEELDQKRPEGKVPYHRDLTEFYTEQDKDLYGDFKPALCQKGSIRISRPEVLYRSTEILSRGTIRRSVWPWYVGLQRDGYTLDMPESDDWKQLGTAHNLHETPTTTPTGHSNWYGRLPYKFPASVHLPLKSHLGRAILCGSRWEDPLVQREVRLILGTNRVEARLEINRQRADTLQGMRSAFKDHVQAELLAFGSKSFYATIGRDDVTEVIPGVQLPLQAEQSS